MHTFILALLITQTSHFKPLFNGMTLDGWTIVNGDPSTWVVTDNMIKTTGKPIGVIRTNQMYENFILELDWKHALPNGNAGLFVWSDPLPAKGVPFTRSIEVQIMDGKELDWYTTHGDIFSIWGASLIPDDPHPSGAHVERCLPSERRSKPAPEWNHYVVTCIDGQINLAVNGAFVSGGTEVTPRKGYICLEAEGTEAYFKNLRILELPPTAPSLDKDMIAEEAIGFTTLFTGINLNGWKTNSPESWNAQGNVLRCEESSAPLFTDSMYKQYECIFDYRCDKATSTCYVIIDGKKTELPSIEIGKWTRFKIQGTSGPVGIGGSNASFTNLFIRTLK